MTIPTPAAGQPAFDELITFVRLGYGDRHGNTFRSLYFRTERLSSSEAIAVVALVESYNAFQGADVARALEAFKGRVVGYEFGRERSPLLHIELPYWTHQREGSTPGSRGERISDQEHAALVAELQAVFVDSLSASQFAPDPNNPRTIIVWWD